MNNLNGNRKNEFRRKQEEKQRKLALKIEDEAGELREGSLKSEEAIPSLDELCAIGERVEQLTTFSAKEAMRNKIKARRDAERYKTTSTDSEKWTPNPFEDSNAAAIESPKNEDTINTTRKHADAVINLELDMPNAKLNAEVASRLKQITGGDSITVQRKYLSPVTLTRRIKFVFAGNYPLCIDGEDDALQKRIVFLPFDESIPDDQQDPYLEDKIWDERDAIVTKSLHYARKLVKLNYKFPEIPQVDNAKCVVRDSIAKTVEKFVQESCDVSESEVLTATEDLYNAYLDYCKEKKMWECSLMAFKKALIGMDYKHKRVRRTGEDMIARKNPVSAFKGIRLRP